jgi:hypothetical protein
MRQSVTRQNPTVAKELSNINSSYAMLTRIENAANRNVESGGVFTPRDLLAAVKKGDTSARDRTFARGDALFQKWAEAANKVLPKKLQEGSNTGLGLTAGAGKVLPTVTGPVASGLKSGSAYVSPLYGSAANQIFSPNGIAQAIGTENDNPNQ